MNIPILIKDLGMQYTNENMKYKRRFGLFLCPSCKNEYKAQIHNVSHGQSKQCKRCACIKSKTTHGLRSHRLYKIYHNMKERCFSKQNQAYSFYGGKGITICDDWLNDFISFYNWAIDNGYKDNLTIDRINTDSNYEPDNCRWVNMSIQAQNTKHIRATNKSGYRGVSWYKNNNKWKASISVNNKVKHLGYFENKIDAAKSYNSFVIQNNLNHSLNEIQ